VLSFGNISCRAVEQRSDFNRVWRGVDLSRMFFGDEDDVDSEANHPVAFLPYAPRLPGALSLGLSPSIMSV
jgi:hypothetical protein